MQTFFTVIFEIRADHRQNTIHWFSSKVQILIKISQQYDVHTFSNPTDINGFPSCRWRHAAVPDLQPYATVVPGAAAPKFSRRSMPDLYPSEPCSVGKLTRAQQ